MPGHQLLVLRVLDHICQPGQAPDTAGAQQSQGFMNLCFQPQFRKQSLFNSTGHRLRIAWC